jgi:DNA-binding LacI/PurR family transcriptional regulator
VARAAIGVSLSTIQRFVNEGTKLHASKLAKIEAALQEPLRIVAAAEAL